MQLQQVGAYNEADEADDDDDDDRIVMGRM